MIRQVTCRPFAVLMFTFVLAGCQVPKNIEPFANATAELRGAVVEGGAVAADAMATVPDQSTRGNTKNDAKEFVVIWQDRVKLMDVLLGYADALAGVAATSGEAQKTTEALGDSIMQLADIVPSTGSAVASGVQLGQLLIRTGIQIKAFHDLDRAVSAVHPALLEVAKYLEADLDDLRRLYLKASQDLEGVLDETYGKREAQRHTLLAKRDELRDAMISRFNDDTFEQVMKMEELVAHMAPEHQTYIQQREALLKKRATTIQMFDKAKQGVRTWGQVHEELKLAIAQNRQPNVRLILSTAQEIKDAVNRIRDQ